jgi:hypothetical protein
MFATAEAIKVHEQALAQAKSFLKLYYIPAKRKRPGKTWLILPGGCTAANVTGFLFCGLRL